jgi:hypothetical protein
MSIDEVYEQHVRPLPLAEQLRLAERIVAHAAAKATALSAGPLIPEASPKPLLPRLRAIRARIEASGEPLLDEQAVRREVAERRGGFEP